MQKNGEEPGYKATSAALVTATRMLLPIFLHGEECGYEARLLVRIQRLDVIYFTVWDRSNRKSRDLSIGGASPGLQSFTLLFLLTGKTDVGLKLCHRYI